MRIATWNVNSITARLPRLLAWLESSGTDVLCLQETKSHRGAVPRRAAARAGLRGGGPRHRPVERRGGDLPRRPRRTSSRACPASPDYEGAEEPRAISATCGPVRVWSVYVPNGREVGHAHYAYKLRWLEALREAVAGDAAGGRPFAVLGDFNVAPTDDDVWDVGRLRGRSPTSPPPSAPRSRRCARRALGRRPAPAQVRPPVHLLGLPPARLPQEPRHAHRPGVRQRPVRRRPSPTAYVDREERKGKGASDHAPGRGRPGRLGPVVRTLPEPRDRPWARTAGRVDRAPYGAPAVGMAGWWYEHPFLGQLAQEGRR